MSKPTCVCISSCALHKWSVIICREVPFLSGCGEHLQLYTTISHERLLRVFSGEVKLAKWGPAVLVSGHRAPTAPRHWEKKIHLPCLCLGFTVTVTWLQQGHKIKLGVQVASVESDPGCSSESWERNTSGDGLERTLHQHLYLPAVPEMF